MKKTVSVLLFYITIFNMLLMCSCSGGETDPDKLPDFTNTGEANTVNTEAVNKIIESFSSPIEMAALIESMKVPYSKKYLVPTEKAGDFDTNFKKALGLGMLSSDLGYLNVYHKQNEIIEYLTAIKRISDDLDVDKFFEFQTLKRLATNSDNLDSLMFLSVKSYHNMDAHLRETERSDLSALMVTGVWLEGLYLAVKVNEYANDPSLRDRIGEQKTIINDMLKVLNSFKSKPYFDKLIVRFEEMRAAYEGVEITTQTKASQEIVDKDGTVLIIDGTYTVVNMTDEQLNEIATIIEKTRDSVINL